MRKGLIIWIIVIIVVLLMTLIIKVNNKNGPFENLPKIEKNCSLENPLFCNSTLLLFGGNQILLTIKNEYNGVIYLENISIDGCGVKKSDGSEKFTLLKGEEKGINVICEDHIDKSAINEFSFRENMKVVYFEDDNSFVKESSGMVYYYRPELK